MESIRAQDYPNIVTIVHTDDPKDDYVEGDIIIRGERDLKARSGYYNLYNNSLLDAIPSGDGYYFFIDDDDMYYDSTVISKAMANAKRDYVNVARVQRWNNTIWPKTWRGQKSFQTECFFLHTMHKNKARWWDKKGGDHYYTRQLTATMPINWVEDLIICKAQDGKGHGLRYDLGDKPEKVDQYKPRPGRKCYENVKVEYIKDVKTPYPLRGNKGDIKILQRMRAERLESKGKVRIIEEVANG